MNDIDELKKLAGIKTDIIPQNEQKINYKIGSQEWFKRSVNDDQFSMGFRGLRKK